MSAPRAAPSIAPASTRWRASPRRWPSSLAPHNIRVNTLGPTFLETPMTRPFFENKAFRDEVLVQDQARPPRPARRTHRRDRLSRLRRLLADDRLGPDARRRLDRRVSATAIQIRNGMDVMKSAAPPSCHRAAPGARRGADASPDRLQKILTSGVLRVGTTMDTPMFSMRDPATGRSKASTWTRWRRSVPPSASRSNTSR